MKLYIARDYDGELWVYTHRPILDVDTYKTDFSLENTSSFKLYTKWFPEVTFENSPMEVELVIKK